MKEMKKTKGSIYKEVNFNGAAVIDQYGREIPITEEMIQSAFEKLLNVSMLPTRMR